MPDIRLQDYVTKIKELIRSVRLDEAIAHSQHILRHYPKHVETYSLLGEACLEKEMYREAIEFFQRTLGADPESLIARVGLGVIYDEQGAFPEAIWQLERAFELVPGNSEVRRELLRLYGQYDEIDKTRLKLTRGALGRLYSRNGLYERAIGEFHAVLRQDPELPDIRVALVEALWREGRQLEAVEMCMELLDALPNCLKANLILGDIWLRGGNEEAAEQRLSVARALDPENGVAQELMGSDSPLPPEEVLIPELDAIPDEFELALSDMPGAGAIVAEEALETISAEAPEEEVQEPWGTDEELPEWLRDVGVTAEEPALELAPDEAVLEPPPEEAVPAEDMPEWLQEVMGEEVVPPPEEAVTAEVEEFADEVVVDEEAPEPLQEAESPDMAGVALAGGAAVAAGLVAASMLDDEEQEPAGDEEPTEEMPEWLEELVGDAAPPLGEEPVPEVEGVAELPVAEVEVEVPSIEEEALPADEVPPEGEVPGWLDELGAAGAVGVAALSLAEGEEEAPPEGEVPDLAADLEGDLDTAELEGIDAPLAAEVEAEAAVLEEEVLVDDEEIPDWLRDLGVADVEEEAQPAEEMPDWLRDLDEAEVEEVAGPAIDEIETEDLSALPVAAVDLEPEEEAPPVDEAPPDDEAPGVLDKLGTAAAVGLAGAAALALTKDEEEAPPAGEAPPDDEVLAVEALAVDALAGDSPDEVPDWLRDLDAAEVEEVAEPMVAEVETEEAPSVAEEVPLIDEIPDWLRDLDAVEVEEVAGPPVAEAGLEEVGEGAVPASLLALVEAGLLDEADLDSAMAEMSAEELEAQRAEEVPEWLSELVEEEPAVLEAIEPEPEPLVEEAVLEAIEPEPEPLVEEAVLEAIEPEPEPLVEEAVLEVTEPEAEVLVEEAVLEAVEPDLEPLVEEAVLDIAEPAAEILVEDAVLEAVEPEPEPLAEEAVLEVAEPEAEILVEEAVLEAVEAELEPLVEESVLEVTEPEAEALVEEAVLEAIEPDLEPLVEEAVLEVAEPAAEVLVEEAVLEAIESEPELLAEEALVEEAVPEAVEAEAEPLVEEAVLEVAEEEVAAPSREDELLQQLKTRPRDYSSRLELARLYYHDQDWDAALGSYEKLISARRFLPDIVDDLESLAQQDVEPARVYHMLGDAYMQQDQLDEALEMYRLARQKLANR